MGNVDTANLVEGLGSVITVESVGIFLFLKIYFDEIAEALFSGQGATLFKANDYSLGFRNLMMADLGIKSSCWVVRIGSIGALPKQISLLFGLR